MPKHRRRMNSKRPAREREVSETEEENEATATRKASLKALAKVAKKARRSAKVDCDVCGDEMRPGQPRLGKQSNCEASVTACGGEDQRHSSTGNYDSQVVQESSPLEMCHRSTGQRPCDGSRGTPEKAPAGTKQGEGVAEPPSANGRKCDASNRSAPAGHRPQKRKLRSSVTASMAATWRGGST